MSSVLLKTPPAAVAKTPVRAVLPSFRALAVAGLSANAPIIAVLLMIGRTWMGVSLLGGYVLALIVYGVLYVTVTQGEASPATAKGSKRLPRSFVLLMVGKFFIIGAAMYVLLCVFHLAAFWILGGFLISQIGVTASIMKHLNATKVTD